MADHSSAGRDSLPLSVLEEVDRLCDQFEAAWQSAQQPRIETYLELAPEGWHEKLFQELLATELQLRARAGEDAHVDVYLARFPNQADAVREVLGRTPIIHHSAARDPAATHDYHVQRSGIRVHCPHCHHPIEIVEADSLREIKCPSCDSVFNLVGNEAQRADAVGQTIGHFDLLARLGTGGFGTVWKARDTKLDRIVAIKIPRRSQLEAEDLEQFFREARAAARLRHPNIVSVHEVGRDGETAYIVSDYVEGMPLDRWLEEQKLTFHKVAVLCAKIAKAAHHAHEAGVVHRDLKPSNIILDGSCEPHVTDFGLAKRETGEITMTVDGQILGTPAYMSPEQARGEGHQADRRTDVYSLGVILYELLTGELPFRGSLRMLLNQVLEDDPPSLRKLDSAIPRDLETVALKCLQKEPARRYDTAQDLADELSRFERGEPIQARPVSNVEWAWRWCKRNPLVAGLSAAVFVVLLAGAIVSSSLAVVANGERNRTSQEADRANAQTKIAAQKAREALDLASKEKNARESMQFLLKRAEDARHATLWGAAQRAFHEHDIAEAERNLAEVSRAYENDWPTRHLRAICRRKAMPLLGHVNRVNSVAFSPDGRRIVSGSSDGTLKVWDATTGQELLTLKGHPGEVSSVAFSPDGRRIVSGSGDKTLKVWDATTGQELLTLKGHAFPVFSVAFSPDGQRIVSGSGFVLGGKPGEIKVWDATTGQELLTLKGRTGEVSSVAFSPDGRWIVSGSWDRTLKLWDAKTGQESLTLKGHTNEVLSVAFSPDGRRIVSGSRDKDLKVWDATTGLDVLTLKGHTDGVLSVAFSPDGRRIMSGSGDKTLKVWDATTGKEVLTLKGHTAAVFSVAFSPDGRRIVSGAGIDDNTLKVWDATTGQESLTLKGHTGEVSSVAFSPDGRRIVSGSGDRTLKVWDATTGQDLLTLKGHTGPVTGVAFSPDGRRIVSGSGFQFGLEDKLGGMLKVWDAATGQEALMLKGHPSTTVHSVAFSPDGRRIVSGSGDGTLKVWDATTGQGLLTLQGHTGPEAGVAFSPDGRRIMSSSARGAIVWDATTGQELLTLKGHTASVFSVAFSPDGRWIVSGSWDRTLKLWDATTGQESLTLKGHADRVSSVAFSPDGRWIVSGSGDGTLKLWDATTGQDVLTLKGHTDAVLSVAFSPDGLRIVSGSGDKTIKVWDATTGQEALTLKGHTGGVGSVAFSSDGGRIASASYGFIRVWDAGIAPQGGERWQPAVHSQSPKNPGILVDTNPDSRGSISQETQSSLRQFVGNWTNTDGEAGGTTKLKIVEQSSKWTIHAWGKCHPEDCDWGEVPLEFREDPKSATRSQIGIATWDFKFEETRLVLHIEKDVLVLEVSDTFKDNSGRQNSHRVERFKKTN